MSGIILSGSPENILTTSTPQLQAWHFSPSTIERTYIQGGAVPTPVTVLCQFLDVMGTSQAAGLSNIRYRTYVASATNTSNALVMSGEYFTGPNTHKPYSNGMVGNVIFSFQNLNMLAAGNYIFNAVFEIFGTGNFGMRQTISTYQLKISLRVFTSDAPQVTPAALNFNWVLGAQTSVALPFTISGTNWAVYFPSPLIPGGTNFTTTYLDGGGIIIAGSGTVQVYIAIFAGAIASYTANNPVQYSLSVNGGLITIPFTITVIEPTGLYISRTSMEFVAYKGVTEALLQSFTIFFTSPYQLQCPPWLFLSSSSGTGNSSIEVTPLGSANLQAGIYSGTIKVLNSTTQVLLGTIAVTYRVIELLDNPYRGQMFSFTLDPIFLDFINARDNVYYQLTLEASIGSFYGSGSDTYTFNYKIPLFKHRQKFNVGKIVERLMSSMPDLLQEHPVPYQPALVNLGIQAFSSTEPAYTETININGLQFVSGMDPGIVDGFAILDINPEPQRIFPESYRFVNLLCRTIATTSLFRNGELVASFSVPAGLFTLRIDFSSYGAVKGDVFEIRLNRPGGFISKVFNVFPSARATVTVVWENEYRLKSVMELTGDYSIKSDFENRSQNYSFDLVSQLVKLESEKLSKVAINTGFLMQSDQATVESLARARRAILLSTNKILQVVPVPKSLENVNSNRDVVSFDLEFQINPTINEEVYSF